MNSRSPEMFNCDHAVGLAFDVCKKTTTNHTSLCQSQRYFIIINRNRYLYTVVFENIYSQKCVQLMKYLQQM